jgi:hypothetical protein
VEETARFRGIEIKKKISKTYYVVYIELIIWKYKPKQFLQTNTRFERKCETHRPLIVDEHISWILHYHDGRIDVINKSDLVIDSFTVAHEGIAICQIKDKYGNILDEKYFFLTNDRKIESY